MDPDWNDAVPSWRQPKTPQSASGRAATANSGKARQWATVPHAIDKSVPTTALWRNGSTMRSSASTPGLAAVGLGKFNIGALHEANQQPHVSHSLGECDDFFPGGLGIPDSFQGERLKYAYLLTWKGKSHPDVCCGGFHSKMRTHSSM